MSEAGILDDPIARTFPLWIRSVSAESVSSMSVAGSGYVDLVEVDVVGLQATQRVLDRGYDPAPRGSLPIGIVAHRATELGREDDAVTTPFEHLAHDLFGVAVGVGGVDKVDARVRSRTSPASASGRSTGTPPAAPT
jgi:hypothetical protein